MYVYIYNYIYIIHIHWVALNTPDTSGGNWVDTEVFFVPSPAGLHTCQLKQQEAGGGP